MGLKITAEGVARELEGYRQRIKSGLEQLQAAEDPRCGVTPREVVYREDKLTLYRYLNQDVEPGSTPLLIVYALVNRPYMADLQEDRSLIRRLLEEGREVYLIDWGYPDLGDTLLTLDDYINGYIDRCVEQVCQRHGLERINLLGICQGGAFSLCYSALHPDRIKNLVTMVTPVDFKTPDNMLSAWVQELDVDLLVDTQGNIPGEFLNWTFLSLKPFALASQKYVQLADLLENEPGLKNFLRMERWINDSPDQAGEAFRQFITWFYKQNGLLEGGIELGGQTVDLKQIRCPLLNIYGEQDHLVPPAASRALKGRTGSRDYTELAFPGGHIGIYVSGSAQATVPPAISGWLKARE